MRQVINQTVVFDSTPVYCLQKKEAKYLATEVPAYLKHGIAVNDNDVVFDVGANIGIFSLWLHLKQNQKLRIFAFEPIPQIAEILNKNAKRLASKNITVIPKGLGRENAGISLTYYPKATVWSTGYPDAAYNDRGNTKTATLTNLKKAPKLFRLVPAFVWSALIDSVLKRVFHKSEVVDCDITTFSDIITSNNISEVALLKIDAEYAEWDVLNGINDHHWPIIKQIVLELHDVDDRLNKVKNLLQKHGFHNVIVEQQDILKDTTVYQIYASR